MSLLMDALKSTEEAECLEKETGENNPATVYPKGQSDNYLLESYTGELISEVKAEQAEPAFNYSLEGNGENTEQQPTFENSSSEIPDISEISGLQLKTKTASNDPPIDHEDLKSERQQHARKPFTGETPVSKRNWVAPVAAGLVSLVIVVAGTGGYIWLSSELMSDAPLTATTPEKANPQAVINIGNKTNNPDTRIAIISKVQAATETQSSTGFETKAPSASRNFTQPAAIVSKPQSKDLDVISTPSPETIRQSAVTTSKRITIKKGQASKRINRQLNKAWQTYQTGDYLNANALYSEILKEEPLNHDALSGKASIALQKNNISLARKYYIKLLERNPQDPIALSALLSLTGRHDPVTSISQIKLLLDKYPEVPGLHFTLGSLYVAQSRWIEAQQAFFNAWVLDRNNADYIYNLAIAMDHLGKQDQALSFYQRALDLAESQPASFPSSPVLRRILEISATDNSG